jgi:hypothetical protein
LYSCSCPCSKVLALVWFTKKIPNSVLVSLYQWTVDVNVYHKNTTKVWSTILFHTLWLRSSKMDLHNQSAVYTSKNGGDNYVSLLPLWKMMQYKIRFTRAQYSQS